MEHSILLVEDDEILAQNIQTYLERKQFEVTVCHSAEDALEQLQHFQPDAVLTDNSLPGMNGHELLKTLTAQAPDLKVIMMTGYGNVEDAVAAMKEGAFHYLTKPVALAELKLMLDKALATERMERTLSFYQEREASKSGIQALIGESPAMLGLKHTLRQLLDAEQRMTGGELPPVLVEGETGTGKELVARAIYHHSRRSRQPFLAVNCAAIPEQLLESELFGHEKGAFTGATHQRIGRFEQCHGGTIFLDEIGDMSPATQTKILRVLQEGTFERVGGNATVRVDVRVIAATNQDLERAVAEKRFREDLFYRLNVVRVRLPPLRERPGDIPLLADYFLRRGAQKFGRPPGLLSAEALALLERHSWPGNVRELENALQHALVVAKGETILPADLPASVRAPLSAAVPEQTEVSPPAISRASAGDDSEVTDLATRLFAWARSHPQRKVIEAVERALVVQALKETRGNQVRAAQLLGMTRATLRKRIERFGIRREFDVR